jgi:hypothetical protein
MNSGTEWNALWYGLVGCDAVYCFDYMPVKCYHHHCVSFQSVRYLCSYRGEVGFEVR